MLDEAFAISICIPAYKRTDFLKRLLDSIATQTFKDFEVIVTDDSPNEDVAKLCQQYSQLNLKYFRNDPALGTPANWNQAISKASGEWIKLIHDDDWLANENAVENFWKETKNGRKFIFSAYTNILSESESQEMRFPSSWKNRIIKNPVFLLPRNVIGPPSVTLIHKSILEQYDEQLKWRVDIEYYMRLLKSEKTFSYIDKALINVGIGYTQVTNYCKDHPEVELPEGLVLLNKYGTSPLKDILVYDAWWRILRNVHISNREQLLHYAPSDKWPEAIFRMIRHQSFIPYKLLKFGPVSKMTMAISYLFNRNYL